MNTQAGKSVGIALLLAAGLIAVLFAFGVFAPKGAAADIAGFPAPDIDFSAQYPGAEDVTLTIEFQLTEPIDARGGFTLPIDHDDDSDTDPINAANNRVQVVLPEDVTAGEDTTITLTQGKNNVGRIIVDESATNYTIVISTPEDGSSNGVVQHVTPTTLTVSGLSIADDAETAQDLTIIQGGQLANLPGVTQHSIGYFASITTADATVSPATADEGTELTLTFEADTESPSAGTNDVVITLPSAYDLDVNDNGVEDDDTDNTGPTVDTGVVVTPSGDSGDTGTVGAVVSNDGDTITVSDFAANSEITVTITGISNPSSSMTLPVMFQQGEDEATTVNVFVTDADEIAIQDLMLDPFDASASPATMTFEFDPVVDDDIVVSLNSAFGGNPVLSATQEQEDGTVGKITAVSDMTIGKSTATGAVNVSPAGTTPVRVTITGLENPGTVGTIENAVTVKQGGHPADSASIRLTGVQVSTTTAGAAVRVKISTLATNRIPAGEDIIVNLPGFTIPDSIDADQILFDGGDPDLADTTIEGFYGVPASVSAGSDAVTLSIPIAYPNGNPVPVGVKQGNVYTITFKLGAGLKNQTVQRGDRGIGATDDPITNTNLNVTSKVASGAASRGETHTFSVVGLRAGSATIYLMVDDCIDVEDNCSEDDDFRIGYGLQEDGRVEVERRVTSTQFQSNAYGRGPTELNADEDGLLGTNVIYSVDGTGVLSDSHGRFTILPSVDVAPDSIKQGGLLELEVADWYYGNIMGVNVGGVEVTQMRTGGEAAPFTTRSVNDGEAEFIVVMPPGIRLGEQQLTLVGTTDDRQGSLTGDDSYSTFITVDPLDLSVDPVNDDGAPEVVINQEFTIEGKGFNTETGACILSVKFGDVVLRETTAGVDVDCNKSDGLRPDTAGNFQATFRLDPDDGPVGQLKIGEYRVEVKDNEERVGLVDVLIPEPVVTVTPEESRRGQTVTVVGSKFPASPELAVEIKYGLSGNEKTIGAATPDSTGNFRSTFVVPTTAVIGEDHVVLARPIDTDFDQFEGKGTHRLPEQELIVTPGRVAAGGVMTLEGHNMPLFTRVSVFISNINVLGQEIGVVTDGTGSFILDDVLVPQLQPGIHTVEALVATQGDRAVSVRTSVEVADIVTRPTAEVFEDLIEAGILTVVWRYDNASGSWASYDPAAPAEVNDLDLVSTDDIVWVQTTADYTFQGKSYLAGWNLYSLE